jgi:hypothetical protein
MLHVNAVATSGTPGFGFGVRGYFPGTGSEPNVAVGSAMATAFWKLDEWFDEAHTSFAIEQKLKYASEEEQYPTTYLHTAGMFIDGDMPLQVSGSGGWARVDMQRFCYFSEGQQPTNDQIALGTPEHLTATSGSSDSWFAVGIALDDDSACDRNPSCSVSMSQPPDHWRWDCAVVTGVKYIDWNNIPGDSRTVHEPDDDQYPWPTILRM